MLVTAYHLPCYTREPCKGCFPLWEYIHNYLGMEQRNLNMQYVPLDSGYHRVAYKPTVNHLIAGMAGISVAVPVACSKLCGRGNLVNFKQ